MSYLPHLAGLSKPILVEAVYLTGRYLTHGLTKERFLRQLEADVRTKYGAASIDTVLTIVQDIERNEGRPVSELPAARRYALAADLDDLMWEDIDKDVDTTKADDALANMRSSF